MSGTVRAINHMLAIVDDPFSLRECVRTDQFHDLRMGGWFCCERWWQRLELRLYFLLMSKVVAYHLTVVDGVLNESFLGYSDSSIALRLILLRLLSFAFTFYTSNGSNKNANENYSSGQVLCYFMFLSHILKQTF